MLNKILIHLVVGVIAEMVLTKRKEKSITVKSDDNSIIEKVKQNENEDSSISRSSEPLSNVDLRPAKESPHHLSEGAQDEK